MIFLKHIVIVGIMGAGKTLIAKKISKQLNFQVIDLDELISGNLETSIKEMFLTNKEKFQDLEFEILKENMVKNNIIATGDTIIDNQRAWNFLVQNGITVWINPNLKAIFPRLKNSPNRPFFHENLTLDEFQALFKSRIKRYQKAHIELKYINFKLLNSMLDLLK
jgi:shikimate kinase